MYGYRFWEIPDLSLAKNGDLPPRDQIPTKFWIRRSDGIPVRVPNTGMIVSGLPRDRGIGQNIFPGLHEALPEAVRSKRLAYKVVNGQGGIPNWLQLPNGSRCLFATNEQDDMTFEGFMLDWAWVDEPIRQSLYSALYTRLFDQCGPVWFTLTPLERVSAWMYQTLYMDRPPDLGVVEVRMSDNPVNTPEKIQEFVKNGEFPQHELESRLYGRFEVFGNKVLSSYEPDVHVIPGFMPPPEWQHGLVVDPHHKRPCYMLWFAYDNTTRTYHFYREWPTENFFKMKSGGLTPVEYATIIRNAEGRYPVSVRICDPRFGKAEHLRHGYVETSWVHLMAECGLYFDANVPNTGSIHYGINKIESLLRYDKAFPISPTNHPRIYVHDVCENLTKSMLYLTYAEAAEGKEPYQKLEETWKDPVDALRYAVLYPLPLTGKRIVELQPFSAEDLEAENDY